MKKRSWKKIKPQLVRNMLIAFVRRGRAGIKSMRKDALCISSPGV